MILTLFGFILAILTAAITFIIIAQNQPQAQIQMRTVVIAAQTIPNRSDVRPEAVSAAPWPEATVPLGAFEKPEDVVGMVAIVPVYQGQIIVKPMLAEKRELKGPGSVASLVVPEGKVAFSFSLSADHSVANALLPGDYIDILATLSQPAAQQPATTTTAPRTTTTTAAAPTTETSVISQLTLQDVLVLQVGTWVAAQQGAAASDLYTVALDRQDALTLKGLKEQGQGIDLVLRRAGDHKTFTTEPVTLQYLFKRFGYTR
jgi:Flp pilus assembly protein CpaB